MTERISKSAEETTLEDIKLNYTAIKQNIAEAMDKAGRCDTVRIMAVTKTVPCEKINYAESLGIDLLVKTEYRNFSENTKIIRKNPKFTSSGACKKQSKVYN